MTAAAAPCRSQLGFADGFGLQIRVGQIPVMGVDWPFDGSLMRRGRAKRLRPVGQQVQAAGHLQAGAQARGEVRIPIARLPVVDLALETVVTPADLGRQPPLPQARFQVGVQAQILVGVGHGAKVAELAIAPVNRIFLAPLEAQAAGQPVRDGARLKMRFIAQAQAAALVGIFVLDARPRGRDITAVVRRPGVVGRSLQLQPGVVRGQELVFQHRVLLAELAVYRVFTVIGVVERLPSGLVFDAVVVVRQRQALVARQPLSSFHALFF